MPEPSARPPGRNDPCPCGSGRKYKHCCLAKDEEVERKARASAPEPPPAAAEPAHAGPPPRRPQHATQQPWRRGTQNTRGFQRKTTPRKVGGS